MIPGKKILFLVPTTGFGGTELHTLALIDHFSQLGNVVSICFPVNINTYRLYKSCYELNVKIINAPIHLYSGSQPVTLDDINYQSIVFQETFNEEFEYDLVVIPFPSPVSGIGLLSALGEYDVPVVSVFHLGRENHRLPDDLRSKFRSCIKNKNYFIAVSEYVREKIAYTLGVDRAEIDVINNGVTLRKTEKKYTSIKQLFGIQNSILVFTPGRYHSQKAIDTLIQAIPAIVAACDKIHFVLMGDGPEKQKFIAMAEQLGVSQYISFCGFSSDSQNLYEYADIVLLPTRFEGLALRLLESIQASSIIITSDAAFQDRIITDGHNGFIYAVDDADSLANKILEAIEFEGTDAIRQNLSQISPLYSLDIMLQKYVEKLECIFGSADNQNAEVKLEDVYGVFQLKLTECGLEISINEINIKLVESSLLDTFVPGYDQWVVKDVNSSVTYPPCHISITGAHSYFDFMFHVVDSFRELHGAELPYFWEGILYAMLDLYKLDSDCQLLSMYEGKIIEYLSSVGGGFSNNLFKVLLNAVDISPEKIKSLIVRCLTYEMISKTKDAVICDLIVNDKVFSKLGLTEQLRVLYEVSVGRNRLVSGCLKDCPIEKDTKPLVLFFASHINYPPKNGSDKRMLNMLKAYKSLDYKVVISTISRPNCDAKRMNASLLRDLGIYCEFVTLSDNSSRILRGAFNNISNGGYKIEDFVVEELLAEFKFIHDTYSPNIVHINYSYFAYLSVVTVNTSVRCVLDLHDLISQRNRLFGIIAKAYEKGEDHVAQLFDNHSLRVLNYEIDNKELHAMQSFDKVIAITESEAELIKLENNEIDVVAIPHWEPWIPVINIEKNSDLCRLVLVGSNNYLNRISSFAILAAIDKLSGSDLKIVIDVYGDICNSIPDVNFIRKHYFVDDLSQVFIGADFSLCLIPFPTGQNIKVSESLSRGVPVIVFPNVAINSGVYNGVNGLIVNSIDDLANILKRLSDEPDLITKVRISTLEWGSRELSENVNDDLLVPALEANL